MSYFVESTVPLKAVKSAVELQHSHENKALLDSLTSDGSSLEFLAADGQYHALPEMFSVDAFLLEYNQSAGNVEAKKGSDSKLYLQAVNHFADDLGGKVIGSIEVEQGSSNKQLNVSIAEVDVNSGAISENALKYIVAGSGMSVGYAGGVITLYLDAAEEPFTKFMQIQSSATLNHVAIFDASGQVIDGGILLSDLCTALELHNHASDSNLHVTAELQAFWSAKQEALTASQLLAVNSGITAEKVAAYDAYATSKLNSSGFTPNSALVTDSSGKIVTEEKFDPATKISVVSNAVEGHVVIFGAGGSVKDSGIVLGAFSSSQTVKEYIDTQVNSAISGSSYQGTFTYFGTPSQVESQEAEDGNTAVIYSGSVSNVTGLKQGTYNGSAWAFEDIVPIPGNGAWFEFDYLLTNTPPAAGRVVIRMDGVSDPTLDVRVDSGARLDDITLALNSDGYSAFKMRALGSGKSVLNATTSDNIAYTFTSAGGVDNSVTVKEQLDFIISNYERAFSKNSAFNKNFDSSSGGGASTMVIGNLDSRLSDARPASDVSAWAKASTKPTYTYSEVGALGANQTAVAATKLANARTIRVNLDSAAASNFDGSANVTPGVSGTLPISNGGTGLTSWTSGQVPVGNGTSAPTFRSISAIPASGSSALFTAGGAYSLQVEISNLKNGTTSAGNSEKLGGNLPSYYAKQTDVQSIIDNYLQKSGGTLTGNLVGKCLTLSGKFTGTDHAMTTMSIENDDIESSINYKSSDSNWIVGAGAGRDSDKFGFYDNSAKKTVMMIGSDNNIYLNDGNNNFNAVALKKDVPGGIANRYRHHIRCVYSVSSEEPQIVGFILEDNIAEAYGSAYTAFNRLDAAGFTDASHMAIGSGGLFDSTSGAYIPVVGVFGGPSLGVLLANNKTRYLPTSFSTASDVVLDLFTGQFVQ